MFHVRTVQPLLTVPLPTHSILERHIRPAPFTAAVHAVFVRVLKQTEDDEPHGAEEKVGDEVDDVRSGGEHPDQGGDNGYGSCDDAVDLRRLAWGLCVGEYDFTEAAKGPDAVLVAEVQEIGG